MSKIITRIFSGALKRLGYEYNINPKNYYDQNTNKKFKYGLIKTTSSYSPWIDDKDFQEVYEIVKPFTLIDVYRVYELWTMIGEVLKLNEKGALLEVGVWRGGSSGILARRLELLGSSELLYVADTFSGVVKSSELDTHYNDGEHSDTDIGIVEELLYKDLKLKNVKILQGIFPEGTEHMIPQGTRFCFCHIDVDVYKSTEGIFNWVWDRLVVGGVVVFDDYGAITCDGITEFVNREKEKSDRIYIYNSNGHAIFIKVR
jgi:O-methyltransferase